MEQPHMASEEPQTPASHRSSSTGLAVALAPRDRAQRATPLTTIFHENTLVLAALGLNQRITGASTSRSVRFLAAAARNLAACFSTARAMQN